MSNYLSVAALTSALKTIILQGLQNATWDFPYDLTVTTTPLDVARTTTLEALGQINLYLYHVGPNAAWRNEPLPRQVKKGETGYPPLALDLRYLLTAYAPDNDGIEVHRLLGRAMSVLHDHAILSPTELQAALENSDIHEQVERVRLTPLLISAEEMSSLWNSFQKPYNLSVAWSVSAVLLESTRATKAPLPVLKRTTPDSSTPDQGMFAAPNLGPFTPGIDSVSAPVQQASVRLGETLTMAGHLLAGVMVRVAVDQSRWTNTRYLPPVAGSVTPWRVAVAIPSGSSAEAEWPAGTYMLSVGVTRELGETEQLTNELPFSLAPSISISPMSATPDVDGNIDLTVTVAPEVWVAQRVTLIIGDRTFKPEPFLAQTDTLDFKVNGLAPGKYQVRIRVDGVDSILVDKTTTPPSFVGPELEVL